MISADVKALRHVGLVVENIDRSIHFYEQGLGFNVRARAIEQGDPISSIVGLKGTKLEWAKLTLPGGSLLELIQYHSPVSQNQEGCYPANRHGCSHLAFTVNNLTNVMNTVKKYGGTLGNPRISTDGTVRLVYCYDPDGIILEFVECL